LAYVASFVLICKQLNTAESTTSSSESPITTVYAKYPPPRSISVDKKKVPTPSALESGKSSSRRKVEHTKHHTNTHAFASSSATPFLVGWPPLFSTLSNSLTSLLDDPPLLKIDLKRVSLFDLRGLFSCFVTPDGDSRADEKNANALMHLLNRCHNVCTIFALSGFVLVITGIGAYLWTVLEQSVAIFGSACVGVCIILGIGALL